MVTWSRRRKDKTGYAALGTAGASSTSTSRRRALYGFIAVIVALSTLARLTIFSAGRTDYLVELPQSQSQVAPCGPSVSRSNPNNIKRPLDRTDTEVDQLTALWNGLHALFVNNEPHRDKWNHFTPETALDARVAHANVVAALPAYTTQPLGFFSAKGIVMMAGSRYSGYAATALGILRESGSRLPVEVWFKDTKDETPGWCAELETEGMTCRRIGDYISAGHMALLTSGYQLKVFAILFSAFQEVLYLDADNFVLSNPDTIFDATPYKLTGAVIWQDYWRHGGSVWLPYIVGVTDEQSTLYFDDQTAESGQILWDKKRHWKSLLLVAYYNFYGVTFWYDTVLALDMAGYGDKDTFPLALKVLDEPYHFVPHPTRSAFLTNSTTLASMVQADPAHPDKSFRALFLHSNSIKWSLASLFDPWWIQPYARFWYQWRLGQYHAMRKLLRQHQPLIWQKEFDRVYGIDMDPERNIWRALEHTACRSVALGSDFYCKRTRGQMQRTFGFRFRKAQDGAVCIID